MKRILVCLVAVMMVFGTVKMASAIVIGGSAWSHDFDDNAFVDSVIAQKGGWYWGGGTEAGLLNGDVNDGGIALLGGDYMSFIFTDNVAVNGAGADLAIFEAGFPADDFIVSVSSRTDNTGWVSPLMRYRTTYTGGEAKGYNLNVAAIDLSDFGLAEGASVSAVKIYGITTNLSCKKGRHGKKNCKGKKADPIKRLGCCKSVGGTDLVAIGAMNNGIPVPEPATFLLIGSGLVGLGFMKRKFKG